MKKNKQHHSSMEQQVESCHRKVGARFLRSCHPFEDATGRHWERCRSDRCCSPTVTSQTQVGATWKRQENHGFIGRWKSPTQADYDRNNVIDTARLLHILSVVSAWERRRIMDVDLCCQPNNGRSLKQTISDLDTQLTHGPTRISPLHGISVKTKSQQNEILLERIPARTKPSIFHFIENAFCSDRISFWWAVIEWSVWNAARCSCLFGLNAHWVQNAPLLCICI